MKQVTILQGPHGFQILTVERVDLEKPPEFTLENAIPAINLTKSYSDYSGKSVLEIVETFFTEPPIEKT